MRTPSRAALSPPGPKSDLKLPAPRHLANRFNTPRRLRRLPPPFPSLLPMLLLSFCLAATHARACSVIMGYIRPTNYELVKGADAIVLAQAALFKKAGTLERGQAFGVFKFKVLEHIQGDFNQNLLSVEGDTNLRSWGDPNDFTYTKPDHGPCNPTDYELHGLYVLFLQNWKGKWSVFGPPFTRVNVLVAATNAPWADAVRHYARVATLNDYEREKAALRDLQTRALAGEPGFPKPLAADIDLHFRTPTPAKSFADLRALYDAAADAHTREYVLWACARDPKPEAAAFLSSLLRTPEWLNYLRPLCSYVARAKPAGFAPVFAAALSTNRVELDRTLLLAALSGTATAPDQGLMQKILATSDADEAQKLGDWFVKHPSAEAIDRFTRLTGGDYNQHSNLALVLARMGDTNVLTWAQQSVTGGKKDWLAYYILAQSPLTEADHLARQVIQNGKPQDLVLLVQGYRDSPGPNRLDRIKEIIALNNKNPKLVFWLRRTLNAWAFEGNQEAERLHSQLPALQAN